VCAGSGQAASICLGKRVENVFWKPAEDLREIVPMPKLDNETIELVFIAVTALAVLMQAIVLLFIYLALRKAIGSLREEVLDLRSSLMPVADNTRELIENTRTLVENTRRVFARVAPKAEATASDVARVARGLREQTEELESAAQEILARVRVQTGRMDAMTTNGLDAVDRAGSLVAETVGKPVRQLLGLAAAAKAIVETLRAPVHGPRRARFSGDEDTFV
jgi:methyl-accepting chemotaxis protein